MAGNRIQAIIPVTLLAVTASFGAPSSALRVPVGLTAAVTTGGTVILTWCTEMQPESFTIERVGFPNDVKKYRVAGNVRSYIDSGLARGRTYRYRIKPEISMRPSEYSSVVGITVPQPRD